MDGFEIPNDDADGARGYVGMGQTGSGKTVGGVYTLSQRDDLTTKPIIFIDFKHDPNISKVQAALQFDEIGMEKAPSDPGLYVVRPATDEETVEGPLDAFIGQIVDNGDTVLFIDEAMIFGRRSPQLRRLMTQGRARHVSAMAMTQRPVDIDRTIFTESKFFQVYFLIDDADRKRVKGFVPIDIKAPPLPKHYSYYYRSGDFQPVIVPPVWPLERSIAVMKRRLMPRQEEAGPGEPQKRPAVKIL